VSSRNTDNITQRASGRCERHLDAIKSRRAACYSPGSNEEGGEGCIAKGLNRASSLQAGADDAELSMKQARPYKAQRAPRSREFSCSGYILQDADPASLS
jgi:hypothetical protein